MIDYAKLKQLREETGVSFALCKKALEETKNDIEKAKKKLQELSGKKAADKADRITSAGGIFSYVHHNRKVASLVELQSETDFVSGNDEFKKLGSEIAMQVASVAADSIDELMKQDYIRDSSKTIEDLVKEAILKFGENIKISKMARWVLGNK